MVSVDLMVERKTVNLVAAGSSPVLHPKWSCSAIGRRIGLKIRPGVGSTPTTTTNLKCDIGV